MEKEILQKLEETEFAEKILECLDVEEIQECFREEQIYITEEDAEKILCSVYGVRSEPQFVPDYDMALCAGGKKEQAQDGNKKIDSLALENISEDENLKKILRKSWKNKR